MRLDSINTDSLPALGLLGHDAMMNDSVGKVAEASSSNLCDPNKRTQAFSYFVVTVLGFSFWFFTVVPFASHRETYWWLAMVHNQPFAKAFGFISSTYRPLAQGATWLAFRILDPRAFPTSVLRQTLLQGFIYGMFVLAWWLIYSAAPQRRLFALVAFVAGGVFFSGYVHLFHIYGIFYIPVMLTLGALLRFHSSSAVDKREVWFAGVATLLVFWHPFAAALFVGFFFGYYLDTFWQRSRAQHVRAFVILLVGMMAIAALVVLFPRNAVPLNTRFFGFLVSYRTNEINLFASLVAFLLTQTVVFSMEVSSKAKLATSLFLCALSFVFLLKSLPLLFLWFCAVLIKLFSLRCWSLFFLMLTAMLLPFGGAIGTPIYVLFAIIVAAYATPLGWVEAEKRLAFVNTRYVVGIIAAATIVLLMIRVGIEVPIVTSAADPLLTERERTYQLENVLAWLHNSKYCEYEIAFAEDAGNPINSVESAITRRNRPPAALEDVQLFWKTVLQCPNAERLKTNAGTAIVTFGGPPFADLRPVYKVEAKYAGDAVVWVKESPK